MKQKSDFKLDKIFLERSNCNSAFELYPERSSHFSNFQLLKKQSSVNLELFPYNTNASTPNVTPQVPQMGLQISFSVDPKETLCPLFMKPSSNIRDLQNQDSNQEPQLTKAEASIPFPNEAVILPTLVTPKRDLFLCPESHQTKDTPIVEHNPVTEENKETESPDPQKNSKKKAYSPEEEKKITELVEKYGEKDWSTIAKFIPGRNRKQLRDHYINFIKNKPNKDDFTSKEDKQILDMVGEYGHRWQKIADNMPGRTPIMIKNRYNMKLKKKPKGKASKTESLNDISSKNEESAVLSQATVEPAVKKIKKLQ